MLTETATRAGHNGHAAGEIEDVVCHRKSRHGSEFMEARSRNVPGVRTTFIRFGSREYNRSNHCGPASRGAIAVMSGLTLIAPLVSSLMASGYSPRRRTTLEGESGA